MRLRIPAPEWNGAGNPDNAAACLKFPPTREHDDFFGDGGGSEAQAKHICNGTYTQRVCPLREQCLTFALVNNEHYGTWGGTDALERAYIRRFIPRELWSFDSAPTRQDLEREWPERLPSNFWDDEEAAETDGPDRLPGGHEEE
jgi:hypothetical protein